MPRLIQLSGAQTRKNTEKSRKNHDKAVKNTRRLTDFFYAPQVVIKDPANTASCSNQQTGASILNTPAVSSAILASAADFDAVADTESDISDVDPADTPQYFQSADISVRTTLSPPETVHPACSSCSSDPATWFPVRDWHVSYWSKPAVNIINNQIESNNYPESLRWYPAQSKTDILAIQCFIPLMITERNTKENGFCIDFQKAQYIAFIVL